jgi:hypothetical protein
MSVPTVYLETSVWGSLGPRQPADRIRIVKRLLGMLDGSLGVCVTSSMVREELAEGPAALQENVSKQFEILRPEDLPVDEAVDSLAKARLPAVIRSIIW